MELIDVPRPDTGKTAALLNKVPVVTATFWLIKILSTTIGETFADFLAVQVGLGTLLTNTITVTLLCVTLIGQLRSDRLVPWLYWLTVVEVSIVCTQLTDLFTDQLGVSLYLSTGVFAALLVTIFSVWWLQERTLAITAIDTRRRESFYWAAILVTFALGTAAGDLATEALSLGFRTGAIIFGAALLLVWGLYRAGVSVVTTFWIAYVLTRPFGAALGDLLTQQPAYGGLGLGAGLTSLLFLAVIVVMVCREQIQVSRHGVRTKADGPAVGRKQDYLWAAGGACVLAAVAGLLTIGLNAASSGAQAATLPGPSAPAASGKPAGIAADPTSSLGDLRPFGVIVDDLDAAVRSGDLSGAKGRAKDLEVAWDSAEASLKPANPDDWHLMDDAIDQVLTTIRATPQSASAITTALTELRTVVADLQQKQ